MVRGFSLVVVHPSWSMTFVFLSKIQVVQVAVASFSLSLSFSLSSFFLVFFIRDLLGIDVCVGSYLALVTWLSPVPFVAFLYNILHYAWETETLTEWHPVTNQKACDRWENLTPNPLLNNKQFHLCALLLFLPCLTHMTLIPINFPSSYMFLSVYSMVFSNSCNLWVLT